jgi:hypothetical protein
MTPLQVKRLRQLLWLYFWLLIFEGALRKWLLPGLSTPLLLVRDPVALLGLMWGWPLLQQRPWRAWLQPLLLIAPLAFVLAISIGHGDLFTAIYGCRILVLQLPLIFVFASVFNRDDVIRFAWVVLWLSIPMAMLIATQGTLSENHFLNVGPGGVDTAVFDGFGDRFRPPGTFTFITGVASFFTLAAASLLVVLYGAQIGQRGRLFCMAAGIAIVVAVPVSISRSLLAGYITVLAATIVALSLSRTPIARLVTGLVALAVAFGVATTVPAFQNSTEAFAGRWETAANLDRQEVGDVGIAVDQLQNRLLPGLTGPLNNLGAIPLTGYGIGIGTNVGAQRLSGRRGFIVGEGAWEASLGELGVPLGLAFLLWRVSLAIWILRLALRAATEGNRLPLILTGATFLDVLLGQLSQPTGLGFIVLGAGLTLAACNRGPSMAESLQAA